MRTPTSGIAGELTRPGSYPGYLVKIVAASGTIYLTTLDVDFPFDGNDYVSADLDVTDLSFDGTVAKGGTVVFGDMTLGVWIATLYREFDDALIEVLGVYADAAGEAEPMCEGRCGKPSRRVGQDGATMTLAFEAEATTRFAPRERVQYIIDPKWLIAAGTILDVNGQRWIIDRPKTAD